MPPRSFPFSRTGQYEDRNQPHSKRACTVNNGASALYSPGRPIEGDQEAITLSTDLAASTAGNCEADSRVVAVDGSAPASIARGRCLLRRAHNIREQHRSEHAVGFGRRTDAVQKLAISSKASSAFASQGKWSAPGNSTNFDPGMCSAIYRALRTSTVGILGGMQDQRRHADGRQDGSDVYLAQHIDNHLGCPRTGAQTKIPRPPLAVGRIASHRGRALLDSDGGAPISACRFRPR